MVSAEKKMNNKNYLSMCEFVFVFIQKKIDSSGRCFVLDIFDKRMKKNFFLYSLPMDTILFITHNGKRIECIM